MTVKRLLDRLASKTRPLVFGMVHLRPLPGSPLYRGESVAELEATAVAEAREYASAGLDGVVVENMWDVPYSKESDPASVAVMTRVCGAARAACSSHLLWGIQVLAARNIEALAVAKAAEGFVFGHVGDEGWIEASAPQLLRYQSSIQAGGVAILADIKKKHSAHAVTKDVSLGETAAAVEFFLGDGVIVTGSATGAPPSPAHAQEAKAGSGLPVFLGSGIGAGNVGEFGGADGFIVGSDFKEDGHWKNPLSPQRIHTFMEAMYNS